ncbi:MAG: acetyl-CoA carboxylase biotin carboxylase subunit, partial [bacterium]|nr:acetyl-CoA carboxylase biotin carboxylase subunit [bacterium]
YVIPPFYDSLIAKVITNGKDRTEAIGRMRRALEEFIIEGIFTTIAFHQRVLQNESFIKGEFDTKFIEKYFLNRPENEKQGEKNGNTK